MDKTSKKNYDSKRREYEKAAYVKKVEKIYETKDFINKKCTNEITAETLEIISKKQYTFNEKTVDISDLINNMSSAFCSEKDLQKNNEEVAKIVKILPQETFETVQNKYRASVLSTINMIIELKRKNPTEKIGALNFASAKNIGGGFFSHASAQEENICRCSGLYETLKTEENIKKYYIPNNIFCNSKKENYGCYLNNMIYSHDVPIFRTDDYNKIKDPVVCDFITAPAVNFGIIQRNYTFEGAVEVMVDAMLPRIRNILATFYKNKCTTIVLGAWGAGAFRCPCDVVADLFKRVLYEEGYGRLFERVVFAVLSPESKPTYNYKQFYNMVEDIYENAKKNDIEKEDEPKKNIN